MPTSLQMNFRTSEDASKASLQKADQKGHRQGVGLVEGPEEGRVTMDRVTKDRVTKDRVTKDDLEVRIMDIRTITNEIAKAW